MTGSGGDGPHRAFPAPLVRTLGRVTTVVRQTRGALTVDDLTPGVGPTCRAAVLILTFFVLSAPARSEPSVPVLFPMVLWRPFLSVVLSILFRKSARNSPSVSGWFKRTKSGWFSEHEVWRRYVVSLKQEVCCRRLSPDSHCVPSVDGAVGSPFNWASLTGWSVTSDFYRS